MKYATLKPSDFALPSRRVLPIHTEEHLRRAFFLFIVFIDDKKIINAFDYTIDEIKEIHKNLLRKAEEYNINIDGHTNNCPLCKKKVKIKVKVTFT